MIGLAIMGIITSIALPNINEWTVKMRVDDEISQLHRLLLVTRNTAVNMEQPVTMCPLSSESVCTNDWTQEISVFIDLDGDGNLETNMSLDIDNNGTTETVSDSIIRVKGKLKHDTDQLVFDTARITYQPTGQTNRGGISTFIYCPSGHSDKNRGIEVSLRGRAYSTSDIDHDGKDELRGGAEVSC